MQITSKIGNAKITFDASEMGNAYQDFSGEMRAELPDDLASLLKSWKLYQYNGFGEESSMALLDEDSTVHDPDHFIGVLVALGEIGGEYRLEWEGSSAFWLLHDVAHALYDFSADVDEESVYSPYNVEERDEMRAHAYALGEYIRQGGDPATAVADIMAVAEDHAGRFAS